jgi:hypothetical protein
MSPTVTKKSLSVSLLRFRAPLGASIPLDMILIEKICFAVGFDDQADQIMN